MRRFLEGILQRICLRSATDVAILTVMLNDRSNPARRTFLKNAGGGAGMLACSHLLAAEQGRHNHVPRAKRVIWLFMHGGPSHVDLFDPKPALTKFAGQPVPEEFGNIMTRRAVAKNPLLAPIRPFRPCGESGLEISTFLPYMSRHADDICVIRSMHGDSVNHPQSVYQMNTGRILMGSPSVGAWVAYGLGTENENMPAFVVLPDPGGGLKGGPPAWGNGFLPASYQGVTMRPGTAPILNLHAPNQFGDAQQERTRKLLHAFNKRHRAARDQEDALTARIKSYELAFRMQAAAPELVDISRESADTHRLYGLDNATTQEFGQRCLLARRMIEQGVRFVQVYSGDTNGWDAHSDVLRNHGEYCARTDKPVAGLLTDLRQRGLLDDTLVIWGGEFGRMPMSEQGKGRDHNPWGFSVWLAGAGVRGGRFHGATDAIGLRAETDRVSIADFHATLLHLMGLDHELLSYFHNGLDQRLTGPGEAHVVQNLIA